MKTVSAAIAAAIIATAFVPATASAAGMFRTAPVEKAATEATRAGYYGGGGYYYNSYPRYRYYNNHGRYYGHGGYGY